MKRGGASVTTILCILSMLVAGSSLPRLLHARQVISTDRGETFLQLSTGDVSPMISSKSGPATQSINSIPVHFSVSFTGASSSLCCQHAMDHVSKSAAVRACASWHVSLRSLQCLLTV
jgi:hypothetical protein